MSGLPARACLVVVTGGMCYDEAMYCVQSGDTLINSDLGETLAALACASASAGRTHSLKEQSDSCFASSSKLI